MRTPGYRASFLLGLSAALPIGMVGLALLLTAQQRSGSIAQAGLIPAAFGLGNAMGLLLQGRLIDQFGQARVLIPASLLCSITMAAGVLPVWQDTFALAGSALLAGVAFPATISSMRVLTADLITDPQLRMSGYALLAVSFGLAMVAGPLLASALIAVSTPATAVLVAALVVGAGGLGFALTPASRGWQPGAAPEGNRLGVPAGLSTLVVANIALGFSGGVVAVALPAAALAQGAGAVAGIGFAARSVGDLAGGLAYGVIRWRSTKVRQLIVSLAAATGASWFAAPVTGSLPALFCVLLIGGAASAAISVACSALLDDVAPASSLTTAYTLMVGIGLVANAAGNAVAGLVADRAGAAWAFTVAAAAVTAAVGWIWLRRRTLAQPAAAGR
nr:MFS transporter [Actinopolymorpha pittospori]